MLVIGRDYFFYTREIVTELRAMRCAAVRYIPITPESNAYRALKRVPAAARAWLASFHRRQVAELRGQSFDIVLFIQVHQIGHELMTLYKRRFSQAKFILYYWDSLLTHDFREYLQYFDEAWTFDPADAKREPHLKLLPLFFCERFRALRERKTFRCDLAFVGTAMSLRRYDLIVEYRLLARAQGVEFFDYLYVSPLFYLRTLLRGRLLRGVHFRPLSADRLLAIYDGARAVLDIPENIQSGYTMRTFESLGAHRKLVTVRHDIVGEDFFEPSAVFVLGLHGTFPSRGFLQSMSRPVAGIDRYSLREWLLRLIDASHTPPAQP